MRGAPETLRIGGKLEPGWVRIGVTCSSGRRSLWVRIDSDFFELRAGRGGNDSYVKVTRDNPAFPQLLDVLLRAVFAAES